MYEEMERFWRHVAEGPDCWEWTASRRATGYGQIRWRRPDGTWGVVDAHRAAYMLMNGPIPEGWCVLHHCDNRGCVRPDHLFVGTKQDNTWDMISKGRQRGFAWLGGG